MQYYTPVMIDDLVFVAQYLAANDGDSSFSLDALRRFALYNRLHDNFRIANMLAPFSTVISPWKELFPVFTGLAGAAMLWLSARLAKGMAPSWRFASVMWLAITLLLPMRAGMFVRDFSLNYIYASAVALAAVWCLLRGEARGWRGGSFWLSLLLVTLSAGWHEGPALAVSAGMWAYALLRMAAGRKVSPQWMALAAVWLLVAVAFLYCPGMLSRASREFGSEGQTPVAYRLYDLSAVIALILSAGAMGVIPATRPRLTRLLGNPTFVLFSVSALAGAVLAAFIVPNQRAALWPQLSGIISLFMIWIPFGGGRMRWVGGVASALCVLHGAHAVAWQKRFYDECELVMALYENSPAGTVFADLTMPENVPMTTLSYPSKLLWVNYLHYHQFRFLHPGKPLAVVPAVLRDADLSNSRSLSGDSSVFLRGNALFSPSGRGAGHGLVGAEIELVLRDGRRVRPRIFSTSYVNAKGDTMLFLRPFKVDMAAVDSARILGVWPDCDPFRGDPADFRQRVARETGAPL